MYLNEGKKTTVWMGAGKWMERLGYTKFPDEYTTDISKKNEADSADKKKRAVPIFPDRPGNRSMLLFCLPKKAAKVYTGKEKKAHTLHGYTLNGNGAKGEQARRVKLFRKKADKYLHL